MPANFDVSGLSAYVQENRDLLIKNFALVGTSTRRRISIQTGVKGKANLHFLELSAALQDGTACAFNAQDEIALTERTIETAMIKVDGEICPRTLVGTYAEYLVRINATEESLPFEQYIIDAIVAEINKKIEKLIWQGDTSSADPNLKWIDGFLAMAAADANVIPVSITGTPASVYADILAVYNAAPEEALERGLSIFVSPAEFRAFVQALVTNNYYHYSGPQDSYPDEFIFPGTDARVVRTPGLAGLAQEAILATFPRNLYYGCDVEGDSEDIDIWFSKDNRTVRYEVLWNSGVQYAFPDQIVLGTV